MLNTGNRRTLRPLPPPLLLPALLLAAALLAGVVVAKAVPAGGRPGGAGASPRELVLGQSAPFSGPSAQLGLEYRIGAEAWFAEVNRRGGIHGRRIRLVSRDDRYEPDLTLANTRRLIQDDGAFALFGYVGTPTVKAVLPLVEATRIPLIAPLTGARLLRQPLQPLVFNLRASYQAEIDRMVDDLVREGRFRIAVLYQNDAFGADGLASVRRALVRHRLKPVAMAAVQRNSREVGGAARDILAGDPNGVIVVSSYPSSAAFSRELYRRGSSAQLMNVSFVGTRALQDALPGGQANGIGVAQVVPFPWDRRVPVVASYQRLMARVQQRPSYGFNSLEGFLAAQLMSEGLRRAGPNPSRAALVAGLESIRNLDLGGFRLQLGPKDHDASSVVELTYLGAQPWEP
ncbi:ABC transporter substrate-binding protein [Cyanobium sp. Morenito 9A2]|uniref:ABC transporter substrate-binding protein n=1 Tax=Cyanobium sp. Morenito 9A2 TaxID=2823718 RepID=UPI0020CE317D|nr:ABC transporter substrate-binding protein [Cyanobium sp. Morenito 9A2]